MTPYPKNDCDERYAFQAGKTLSVYIWPCLIEIITKIFILYKRKLGLGLAIQQNKDEQVPDVGLQDLTPNFLRSDHFQPSLEKTELVKWQHQANFPVRIKEKKVHE